jgi:hypothetical protein
VAREGAGEGESAALSNRVVSKKEFDEVTFVVGFVLAIPVILFVHSYFSMSLLAEVFFLIALVGVALLIRKVVLRPIRARLPD